VGGAIAGRSGRWKANPEELSYVIMPLTTCFLKYKMLIPLKVRILLAEGKEISTKVLAGK